MASVPDIGRDDGWRRVPCACSELARAHDPDSGVRGPMLADRAPRRVLTGGTRSPTSRHRWPFLDWDGPIPAAHRGGAGEHPENTMAAFEAAVRLGYRYVETDVHATSDGVLVAFHDHTLDRVTDRSGEVCDLPYAEVRAARVWGHPIALFEEVLGTWPELRVHVDAKHLGAAAPLMASVDRTGAHDRVCVGAFSDRTVLALRRLGKDRVCMWMGRLEIAALRLASVRIPTPRSTAGCTQVPLRRGRLPLVDRRFLDTARHRGVDVHVWTINDRPEMERLLDLGVGGILSDRPTLLKQVFTEHNLWV